MSLFANSVLLINNIFGAPQKIIKRIALQVAFPVAFQSMIL